MTRNKITVILGMRINFNYDDETMVSSNWQPWSLGDLIQVPFSSIPFKKTNSHLRSITIEFKEKDDSEKETMKVFKLR